MISLFLKRILKSAKAYVCWAKRLWHLNCKCAYLIGTPTHTNIGDSAIVVAQIKFLRKCGYEKIVEITVREYESFRKCIVRLMPKNADIFLPGGGNMGSLWPAEEQWRSQIIEDFSKHNIVVFPQTIYYSNDDEALTLQKKSIEVYNTKPSLTVVAREKTSYDLMRKLYPDLNVLLTPDIVLSMKQQVFDEQRRGILACFRNDKERSVSSEDEEELIQKLKISGYDVEMIDTMSESQITVENRNEIVENKLRQIAKARLIITDRLHGMVFAAITGTPCIVLGNNHHKVEGTYQWLKSLDYIEFVSDIKSIESKVPFFYDKKKCSFYLETQLFASLLSSIKALND